MALRSAHKKHPASADSEQTTTDESTTEGQEQVFLILTGQEPGGKHAFIARDEFNRSTYKKQDKREYKHYGLQSAVFNQALGISDKPINQADDGEEVAALQCEMLESISQLAVVIGHKNYQAIS